MQMTSKTTTENQNETATPNEGELNEGELNKVVGGTSNVVQLSKDAAVAGIRGAAEGAVKATQGFGPLIGH
jgi:hypothetical protein